MYIDHIGIVVKNIKNAIEQWESVFGYQQKTSEVINTKQKVKIVFMGKNGSLSIKLVEPLDRTSPVFRFAMKGGGVHHLCFMCDDVIDGCKVLQNKGLRLVTPPEPGEAFANENIAFFLTNNGLNIEIIDTDKRAGLR